MDRSKHTSRIKHPDPRMVRRYEDNDGKTQGPDLEDFRPDVYGGFKNRWNKRCAKLVARHICEDPGYAALWTEDEVARAFSSHMASLRQHAKKLDLQADVGEDSDADEQRAKVQASAKKNVIRNRRQPVRFCLFAFTVLCTDTSVQLGLRRWMVTQDRRYPELNVHADYVERAEVHSDDESGGIGQYTTLRLKWRSEDAKHILHTCDFLHIGNRINENGQWTQGATPRIRVPGVNYSTDRPAPHGLPKNYYSTDFLRTLTLDEVEDLGMLPTVPIEISKATREVANRYKACLTRKCLPKLPAPSGQPAC